MTASLPSRPATNSRRGAPYLIAEIGSAHRGDLSLARELIHAAAEAGADCAKFQIIYADEILHPSVGLVNLPGGATALYDRFRLLERDIEFYDSLRRECERCGVDFLATVFGKRSLKLLGDLGERRVKIASPELNHIPLLRATRRFAMDAPDRAAAAADWSPPALILSTGVSTLSDIERATETTRPCRVALLHCVTAYPAPASQYNLRIIPALRSLFGAETGVSDHTLLTSALSVLAFAVGATIVEKHICLSNRGGGLDDPIALTPKRFASLRRELDAAAEYPADRLLSELRIRYGAPFVERALGDGVKRLACAEKSSYGRTNRSILARRDIAIGERLDESNCDILRSERNLAPGLAPRFWSIISGCELRRALRAGSGIQWSHVLDRDDDLTEGGAF